VPVSQRLIFAGLGALLVYAVVTGDLISTDDLLFFAALFPSIILHEVSHGAAALVFGDDTAKQAGRLTLNPIPHIDPWGSIVLPAILVVTTGHAFGYARPVPVNPRRMRSPRNHNVVVALVGPGTNIVLAVVAAAMLRITGYQDNSVVLFIYFIGIANVILAVFNLLPIPPLDGSAVIERLLPARWWPQYLKLRQYSFGLLLLLVFILPLDRVFDPALRVWERLLP
jgi:Zn-dependent protease